MQISTELHLPSETFRDHRLPRPLDMLISLKCIANTLFDAPEMRNNLPTSVYVWHVSIVSSFPLPLETYKESNLFSFWSNTLSFVDTMFLAMPHKPRFGELGSGLNLASAIYESLFKNKVCYCNTPFFVFKTTHLELCINTHLFMCSPNTPW